MPTATLSRPQTLGNSRDPARLVGRMTPAEYHAFNYLALEKHELIQGEVVRMAGASPEHNAIQSNFQFEVRLLLRQENSLYQVYGSDQKIYAAPSVFLYPDIVVLPINAQFDQNDALRNPVAIVEVLSSSTEDYDKDEKFALYQQIKSLRHYVLIEQGCVSVTHHERSANGVWALAGTYQNRADILPLSLDDVQIAVSVGEIYRSVSFE